MLVFTVQNALFRKAQQLWPYNKIINVVKFRNVQLVLPILIFLIFAICRIDDMLVSQENDQRSDISTCR